MQENKQENHQSQQPTLPPQQPLITEPNSEGQNVNQQPSGVALLIGKNEDKIKELIQSIRDIQNEEVEQEVNETLTEAKKDQNRAKIRLIAKQIRIIENQVEKGQALLQQDPNIGLQKYQQLMALEANNYEPTQQEINQRYTELSQQPNDSSWTDATESQADDDIWVVDDDIMNAMEEDSGEEEIQEQDEEDQGKGDKEQIDYDELEEQFVTGEASDHHGLFGKHDKFCVSVNGIAKESLLVSGGGDDYLFMYKLPNQETDPAKCLYPYHMIKHTQTINKIEISYSKQYIFSMTDNEILCTEIKSKETSKLKTKEEPKQKEEEKKQKKNKEEDSGDEDGEPICSDMVCHHLGDVVAVSSGYELEVYNIKGLKLYQTYYCERMIDMIAFTQTGKQIVLACDDSRLRLLTPKTSEIITVGGTKQHKNELSVIKTKGDIILSGCIDGYIGVTTIKKATMTTLIGTKQTESTDGAINQLEFAGSYFISGSAEDKIDWYDLGKAKKLFTSPIEGSSSDICWQGAEHQYLYNVSTIKGYIHIYDCRDPLKQIVRTRAGNTIHKLWCDSNQIVAACEDGHARYYDIRKLIKLI